VPWATPTLRQVRERIRDDITSTLSGAAVVGNTVLRVMADAQAGLTHLVLKYIDWLALQLLPDTAEKEWLDRHGDIWLQNSDGSTGRKAATYATGTVTLTGLNGSVVPIGTLLEGNGVSFETTAPVTIGTGATPVAVRALDGGAKGNLETGTTINISAPPTGVNGNAIVVSLGGGADQETDEHLRDRILERIRQPPMGGAAYDYVAWAKAVPGVTRAWAASEMGVGTVTVRVMMDVLRADNEGFPEEADLVPVEAYIDLKRPVTVKDHWVMAPIKERIDVQIADLYPDNGATRAAIEQSLLDMLMAQAKPGQTIFAAWKSLAIISSAGVQTFTLADATDDVMPSIGHMAVLGDITYA
jgi:uncharacterized phage protein gp47/JayE